MILIAIGGKRGVGKTALATYFVQNFGFQKISFAESLKNYASVFFDFKEGDFNDPAKKEKPFGDYDWTPRDFIVRLGDFLRFHDEDYFVKETMGRLKNKDGRYIIDDMRFKNEAEALLAKKAFLVRVNRYEKFNPYGKNLDIRSETELDHFDYNYVVPDFENLSLAGLYSHGDKIIKAAK